MVIYSALVRSHQSTYEGSFGPCRLSCGDTGLFATRTPSSEKVHTHYETELVWSAVRYGYIHGPSPVPPISLTGIASALRLPPMSDGAASNAPLTEAPGANDALSLSRL